MVSVQRSIEIRVPVHTLYSELAQFENYPQFLQEVESVEQRDDKHLHWKAKMSGQEIEWDAAITECVPDKCIAWQSESGPGNAGKVELQAVGPAASRLTLTLVSEIDPEPTTPAGDVKAELSERIWEDLVRLRSMVEGRLRSGGSAHAGRHAGSSAAQETGPVAELGIAQGTGQVGNAAGREGIDEVAVQGSVEGSAQGGTASESGSTPAQSSIETMQRDRGSPGNPVPASGFAAGAEGFSGSEDPGSPVSSAGQSTGSATPGTGGQDKQFSELSREQERNPTQSDYALSQSDQEDRQDGRYSIAEEVSFDQQSDRARHIGNFPAEDSNGTNEGLPNPEVIEKAAHRKRPEPEV